MKASQSAPAPLFRDPIYDGAADPTIIWNHHEEEWWIVYTNRRTNSPGPKFAWVHGTDLGIASSPDGQHWKYRGTIEGLDIERGRNTFWAPEIIFHDGLYHMYVSYIQGVPHDWPGHHRHILHYTSANLWDWVYQSTLQLSSEFVIDAAVHRMPDGKWRMWYKDEANHSHTYAAESEDLYQWKAIGPVITGFPHEGANVFHWKNSYWLIVDHWQGQTVFHSPDAHNWTKNNIILHESGTRTDDKGYGHHADVLVHDDHAYIFYFTHPDRIDEEETNNEQDTEKATAEAKDGQEQIPVEESYRFRRSSVQVAELELQNNKLICDRDKPLILQLT